MDRWLVVLCSFALLLTALPASGQTVRLATDPEDPRTLVVESGPSRKSMRVPSQVIVVVNNAAAAMAAVFGARRPIEKDDCEYFCTDLYLFDLKTLRHRRLPYRGTWLAHPSEEAIWSPDGRHLQLTRINGRRIRSEGFLAARVVHLALLKERDVRRWIHGGAWRATLIKREPGRMPNGAGWTAPVFERWLPEQRLGFTRGGCCDGWSYDAYDLRTGQEWGVRTCVHADQCSVEQVYRNWRPPPARR